MLTKYHCNKIGELIDLLAVIRRDEWSQPPQSFYLPERRKTMSELKDDIYAIIKDYQLAALATINGDGKPWVRYLMINGEKDLTLKFVTSTDSRKVAHIKNNKEVHVTCGVSAADMEKPYLQIQGKAEITRDEKLRKEMWQDFLTKYFTGQDDPKYCVGIIKPYRIELVTASSPKPAVWEKERACTL
jgi:general stress protein 26